MNPLIKLQHWYAAQCDGDWEHDEGIRLTTLDNPGWAMDINLEGTNLAQKVFESVEIERSKNDWLQCFVRDKRFTIRCGPLNLEEGLKCFSEWVEK